MTPTVHDVARLAGVSIKTVSNVINAHPHVRPATREKVQRAIAELGYTPNLTARNLRNGRTGVIALAVPDLSFSYFAELARWEPATPGATVTVITNSVPIASTLQHSGHVELHLLGGRVRGVTSAAVGTATVEQIGALRPDIAFVGTNGLSAGFGLSTPDEYEAAVKGAYVLAARRSVVLADAAKHGVEALMRFARLDEIDTLVTDQEPPADLAGALTDADVEVVVA